jgi:hypothetical protein
MHYWDEPVFLPGKLTSAMMGSNCGPITSHISANIHVLTSPERWGGRSGRIIFQASL